MDAQELTTVRSLHPCQHAHLGRVLRGLSGSLGRLSGLSALTVAGRRLLALRAAATPNGKECRADVGWVEGGIERG